jgi:hypothetical protein
MNLSLSMEYVLLRAAQEAKAFSGGRDKPFIEP